MTGTLFIGVVFLVHLINCGHGEPVLGHELTRDKYRVFSEPKSGWQGAIRSCSRKGGKLALIPSDWATSEVTRMLQGTDASDVKFWFDATLMQGDLEWRQMGGLPLTYVNWRDGHPTHIDNQNCAFISNEENGDYKWQSEFCGERNGYICEFDNHINPPGFCEDNWIWYADKCYFLDITFKSWDDSRESCKQMSADLVSMSSVDTQRLPEIVVTKLDLIDYMRDWSLCVWIGLYKPSNGEYIWLDETTPRWDHWIEGQNEEQSMSRICVCMKSYGDTFIWHKESCAVLQPYVCEKGLSPIEE